MIIEERFPLCKECNPKLFEEVSCSIRIVEDASKKLGVPAEELIDFFYKVKLQLDLIERQEEVLDDYVNSK